MGNFSVNPKDVIFSLDIGTRTVIGTVGVMKDKKFSVICEEIIEHEDRAMVDGQIHDIDLVKDVVVRIKDKLQEKLGFKLTKVAVAAAGRMLKTVEVKAELEVDKEKEITKEMVKSLEMTAVKDGEKEIESSSGGRLFCVGYSVKSYYLNGYLISNLAGHKGEKISCDAIATFLPRSVVDSLYTVVNKAELDVMNMTLEPIAAMEAAVPKNLRLLNIALVDIGAGTSDIAICSKDSVIAYGMVPMAGDEISEAIAQAYLVDFNTAEKIKCTITAQEKATYTDIMGFENEVTKDEIEKLIAPIVDKIATEVSSRTIDLNGGKSPNAIFLVGGGAHTLGMRERIAEKLNLQQQRVGVKGRDAVVECQNVNEEMGSTGVTVLGIALMAVKNSGHDFINITLNGEMHSLFNCYNHSVMDVLLQGGIDPMSLIGKKGKNRVFTFNGRQRVAFGELPKDAEILVNGKKANLDTVIKDEDEIRLILARDGKDAAPKVCDYIKMLNCISFYINDEIVNFEPIITLDGERGDITSEICENCEVVIESECSLENIRKQQQIHSGVLIKREGVLLQESDVVGEGEKLCIQDAEVAADIEEPETVEEILEEKVQEDNQKDNELETIEDEKSKNDLRITVNDEEVVLKGSEKYVFVDVFNFIKFDISVPKGNLKMTLNEKAAGYYDKLSEGDVVKIFWQ